MIINLFYIYGLDQLSYKKRLVRPNQVIPAFFLPSACAQRELLAHFGCSLAVPMRFGKRLPANVLNIRGWKGKRSTKSINLPYPAEFKMSPCSTSEIIYFLKLYVCMLSSSPLPPVLRYHLHRQEIRVHIFISVVLIFFPCDIQS